MAKKEKSFNQMGLEELRLKLTEKMLMLGNAVPYIRQMPIEQVEERLTEALAVYEAFAARFHAPADRME